MSNQESDLEQIETNLGSFSISGQRLADDVIRNIVEIAAAEQDQSTLYSLALTSCKISQWTAKERYRTVQISSIKQLLSFWQMMNCYPTSISNAFWTFYKLDSISEDFVKKNEKSSIPFLMKAHNLLVNLKNKYTRQIYGLSFPEHFVFPHKYVKNLFIDIQSKADTDERLRIKKFLNACEHFEKCFVENSPIRLLKRWENDASVTLDYLSLGPLETGLFEKFPLSNMSVRELTVTTSKVSFWTTWQIWLPKNLERLHMINFDEVTQMKNMEPFWNLLYDLRMLYAYNLNSEYWKDAKIKLTHIRFDTPKNTFKSAFDTALRFGPLLSELTLPITVLRTSQQLSNDVGRMVSHHFDGTPGNGRSYSLERRDQLIPIHELAQQGDEIAKHMFNLGIGQLVLFQLAWDPMKNSEAICSSTKTRYEITSNGTQSAGKDETNAKLEGTHVQKDKDQKNDANDTFLKEILDFTCTKWGGWKGEENIEAARDYSARMDKEKDEGIEKPLYERNSMFKPLKRDQGQMGMPALRDFETITEQRPLNLRFSTPRGTREESEASKVLMSIKENVPDWKETHPQLELANSENTLCYGTRSQKSLIHVGGEATFTYYDRLRVFLDRATKEDKVLGHKEEVFTH